MPYRELDGTGRWSRRARSGSPSTPTRVCKGCGNVMSEPGFTCSEACETAFHHRYADTHGTPAYFGDSDTEPTTGLQALLYLLAGLALAFGPYLLYRYFSG